MNWPTTEGVNVSAPDVKRAREYAESMGLVLVLDAGPEPFESLRYELEYRVCLVGRWHNAGIGFEDLRQARRIVAQFALKFQKGVAVRVIDTATGQPVPSDDWMFL